MKKCLWIALALTAVVFLFSCNKQKPVVLDYKESGKEKLYDPQGLPGEGHVGSHPNEHRDKLSSDQGGTEAAHKEEAREEKKEEKPKPEEKPAKKDQPEKKK